MATEDEIEIHELSANTAPALTDIVATEKSNGTGVKTTLQQIIKAGINDNNTTSTDTILSAKKTTDLIAEIGWTNYITDANTPEYSIGRCNSSTLNTPRTEGLTTYTAFMLITSQSSGNYFTQIAITGGNGFIYKRYKKGAAAAWTTWYDMMDSDPWVIVELADGVTAGNYGSSTNGVQMRKEGTKVSLRGSVSFTILATWSTVRLNKSNLPTEYRPASNHYWVCISGGKRIARVYVNTGGAINVEWLLNVSDGSQVLNDTVWVDIVGEWYTN